MFDKKIKGNTTQTADVAYKKSTEKNNFVIDKLYNIKNINMANIKIKFITTT